MLNSIKFITAIFLLVFVFSSSSDAAEFEMMKSDQVVIQYSPQLKTAAHEILIIYPEIKRELENFFNWKFRTRPVIVLVRQNEAFQRMSGKQPIAAFAVPGRNLVVIDYSKMKGGPFKIRSTLKHEICHLMLHHHISRGLLPKWLDEGLAQWLSDGPAELLKDPGRSYLESAVVSGNLMRLKDLETSFPKDRKAFFLAYEESKSVVEFIIDAYGENVLLGILYELKNGKDLERAVMKTTSLSFKEIEKSWLAELDTRTSWFAYIAVHIYEYLFLLAAVLTVTGFIRFVIKKRKYGEDEEEEDDEF